MRYLVTFLGDCEYEVDAEYEIPAIHTAYEEFILDGHSLPQGSSLYDEVTVVPIVEEQKV
jgi:hypothetical protein